MDKYEIYQLFTATTKGEEQLESFNIRRQFVNTVGKNSGLEVDIPDKNRMDGGNGRKIAGLWRALAQQPTRSRNCGE